MDSGKGRAAGRKRERGSAEELKGVPSVEGNGRAERRGRRFVGGYVLKDFPGYGAFLGKVVSFGAGLYKVWYEDGDCEELDYDELCRISVEKSEFDEGKISRKKSLDQLVYSGKLVNATPGGRARCKAMVPYPGLGDESSRSGFNSEPESMVVDKAEEVLSNGGRPGRKRKRRRVTDKAEAKVDTVLEDRQVELQSRGSTNFEIDSSVILEKTASIPTSPCGPLVYTDDGSRTFSDGRSDHCVDREADSYSDFCESEDPVDRNTSPVDSEIILPPPPPLPPSSTDIDVPLESITELFSVYNFLRSFSHQLFLSPFSFNEFVASLSFGSANSILDAVHVSLLRALKRHLETLSSKGNVLESRILRHLDWSLLDTLTWSVFLAEYLLVSGAISKMKMKITAANFLDGEYYASTVSTKLRILQILCDDVVISAELTAELDMRAEKEILAENDADPSCPTEGSFTDACPERANCPSVRLDAPGCTVNNIYSSQHPSKTSCYSNSLDGKADMPVVDKENAVNDGNSDECCLCGMDGMLVCCDGCPSAYHSRCVGINKAYLPEGSWFCPECVVDKMGSTSSRIGKGLTGAELFGIDPYGHAYFGTCNYLLVLEDSLNQETPSRYYNVDDIPAILTALCSSEQYSSMYSGICKGISKYWDISPPMGKALNLVNNFASLGTHAEKEDVNRTAVAAEQNGLISSKVEIDSYRNHMSENLNTHKALLDHQYACNGSGGCGSSMASLSRADLSCVQQSVGGACGEPVKEESVASEVRVDRAFDQFADDNAFQKTNPTINECQNLKVDPVTDVSVDLPTDGFHQYKQQEDKIPIMLESATCAFGSEVLLVGDARNVKCVTSGRSYQKVDFVPSAYTNQYIHGDIAACAAANLAIIAAEDNKNSSNNASSNPRKFASNIALQMKAFLGAATYFFWPGLEKKSTEIPRDRCGWCISCQFYVNNSNYRKGCLLNAATLNSVKGVPKVLCGGPRPVKNNVGPIAAIAAYVLHIEESLHGLITGPWLVAAYRRQWRKQVEQAASCSKLKFLLHELEENIRLVAFSGPWIKQGDDWSAEASAKEKAAISVRPTQKHGPGRRGKRSSGTSGSTYDSIKSSSNDFHWWCGGSLSKQVLQKGVLLSVRAKKAARQGGFQRIPGVFYSENSEIPRRSRCIAWRSAVEMVKSISQLALQVRYLDAHIRWIDLHRPEQVPQDVKGAQSEAFAFSRVVLCAKAVVNNETRYMLDFGAQGDPPARIRKNVIQADQGQDGKCKYWFSECHIPLYLIQAYEERVHLTSMKKPMIWSSKHQMNKSITFHKDIFSYLIQKLDMPERFCCKQCQKDVLPKLVVKCGSCQGSFHKNCVMVTSIIGEQSETTVTCYACYGNEQNRQNHLGQDYSGSGIVQGQMNSLTLPYYQPARPYMNPVVPAPFSSTQRHMVATAAPIRHLKSCKKLSDSSKFGLILKRNKSYTPAVDFWNKNVLCGGNQNADMSSGPICFLCRKPYSPALLYVRCEFCQNWFHGDAVGLVESLINDVIGFKCCRCRKKCVPICPYADVQTKKRWKRNGKRGSSEEFLAAQELEEMPNVTFGEHMISVDGTDAEDDPFLFSLGKVEPVIDQSFSGVSIFDNSGQAYGSPQKLPVRRRNIQEENGYLDNFSLADAPMYREEKESTMESSQVEWQFSAANDCEDEEMMLCDSLVDCENAGLGDMPYEPQTYFSLTELLASEANEAEDTTNMSMDATDNWHTYTSFETNGVDAEGCLQPGVSPDSSFLLAPCGICALSDPAPDVPCESCGFLVHSTCLPNAISEDGWKCGSCES